MFLFPARFDREIVQSVCLFARLVFFCRKNRTMLAGSRRNWCGLYGKSNKTAVLLLAAGCFVRKIA